MSRITRRPLPLYIATFLVCIPFWYAIEKLFMMSIGFNDATVGVMVACMSLWILAVETPSGIMADRWSRKGVLIGGSCALLASALVGGVSQGVPMFILSCLLWGTFSAMYSGTTDSIIYDTLMEEQGNAKRYSYYLGRLRIVEGAGFVSGALLGGMLAVELGLRQTFFLSLPFVLFSIVFLVLFREPVLHKAEVHEPILRHIKLTFSAILKNSYLRPVVVATIGFAILLSTLFELNQLWFIAAGTPLWAYGVIAAIIFVAWSAGGLVVRHIKEHMHITLVVMLVLASFLPFTKSYGSILLIMFLLCSLLVGLGIVLSGLLHDELPSKLRAGASSFVNTISNACIVPFSLIITSVSQRYSIFTASYLLVGLVVVAVFAQLSVRTKSSL